MYSSGITFTHSHIKASWSSALLLYCRWSNNTFHSLLE